jgi:hypothetical protein
MIWPKAAVVTIFAGRSGENMKVIQENLGDATLEVV